jgi:hypothetical protein
MQSQRAGRRVIAALGAIVAAGACGKDTVATDRDTRPHVATTAELVSPAQFEVPPGDSAVLTVAVRVRDERGKPLPGAEVQWEGGVQPTRMLTDTIGEARGSWVVSGRTTAMSIAYARVITTGGEVRIEFRATVKSGPLVAATVLRADALPRPTGIVVEVGQAVRFTTYGPDAAGHYFTGVPATWSSADPTRATVDQSGVVTGKSQGFVRINAAIPGLAEVPWGPVLVVDPLRATDVAAAYGWSCATDPTRHAVCWGAGFTPAQPPRDSVPEPVRVAPELSFATLRAGFSAVCGVTPDGAAYCLGPTGASRVLPGVSVRTVSSADGLLCGLDAAGTAYCQGSEVVGVGPLGPVQRIASPVPFVAIASGRLHSCAAAADGVYCWRVRGANAFTDPTRVDGSSAAADLAMSALRLCTRETAGGARCTRVDDFSVAAFTGPPVLTGQPLAKVAVGPEGACGITTDKRLLCEAQGVTTETPSPDGTGWSAVSYGDPGGDPSPFLTWQTHTCGATGAGRTYCWGYNTSGELGVTNEAVCGIRPPLACSPTPLPVPSPRASAAIALPR